MLREIVIRANSAASRWKPDTHEKVDLSLRSRRERKAWGVSPRYTSKQAFLAREASDRALPPASRAGLYGFQNFLGLTPQALCSRLLRRLNPGHSAKHLQLQPARASSESGPTQFTKLTSQENK